jgi:signal transduction histidine kinase
MFQSQPLADRSTPVQRALIHDLRNLFGVVASAKHMLADLPAEDDRRLLLDAIESAAMRGGELTSNLLAPAEAADAPVTLDVDDFASRMAPMIRAMAGDRAEVKIDLDGKRSAVTAIPGQFEAALLELVANARAAFDRAGWIIMRVRRHGPRIWVTIADNGRGMTAEQRAQALSDHARTGVKGIGLRRVKQFTHLNRGRLLLRSRPGRGTVVTMILPTVAGPAADDPIPPAGRRRHLQGGIPSPMRHVG